MSTTNAKTLIAIPTYNERENATPMCQQLLALKLEADILFVDDNSPDGTGQILDSLAQQHPCVSVMHRPGKLGIGTAHVSIINYAYEHGYETLVTMDCDFTHAPSDIPRLLQKHVGHDVTLGSRYMQPDSLPGWNILRRSLTALGHFLTHRLLGMTYDATGAFRVYRLPAIPRNLFDLVKARGYSFFFESLFVLNLNGLSIGELPIVLPARTYGHSKMSLKEAARSAKQVIRLGVAAHLNPGQFRAVPPFTELDPSLHDPQDWDAYWMRKSQRSSIAYDFIATVYRVLIIRPNLRRANLRVFAAGSRLLHAGCGGGQVDQDLQESVRITAMDISAAALHQYRQNNPHPFALKHGDILRIDFPDNSFDGVYNLGVMEHFTEDQILQILAEFRRVIVPGGKIVIFWPHVHAPSVYVLGFAHWFFIRVLKRPVQFHPAEVSLLRSKQHATDLITRSQLNMKEFKLGPSDMFIQAVIVAQKPSNAN